MPNKVDPPKILALIEQFNSDHLARLRFLVDPGKALDEAGIQLDDESKSALSKLVHESLASSPDMALLPTRHIRRGCE